MNRQTIKRKTEGFRIWKERKKDKRKRKENEKKQ
jgi:hypothetical protein